MKRIGFGVVLGTVLAVSATAAFGANGHAPMSNDGDGLSMSELASRGRVSSSFSGRRGLLPEGVVTDAESDMDFPALLALEPMTAPVGIELIIGSDDRKRIRATKDYPYSAVALITFEDNEGNGSRCTGWLINRNTVVTAGHCVYEAEEAWYDYTTYRVYPGRNGKRSPFRNCRATRLYTVTLWALEGRDDYDYGAIKLSCNIGQRTGWFGYFWKRGSLRGTKTIITGFPGDKPLTMWMSKGKVTVKQPRRVFYKNDTAPGMSGSPVYHNRGKRCNPCSMAVHAYGTYNGWPYSKNNHGTRITQEVFTNLQNWKRAAP